MATKTAKPDDPKPAAAKPAAAKPAAPKPAAPKPAAPKLTAAALAAKTADGNSGPNVKGGLKKDDRAACYKPPKGRLPGEFGAVALNNWIGIVDGQRREVDRLTPVAHIPQCVIDQMTGDGMRFGLLGPVSAAAQKPGTVGIKNLTTSKE